MKLPKLLSILTEEPLLITPGAHASLIQLFRDHASLPRDAFLAAREGKGMCGEEVEVEQMEIIDGIAHIPIGGPIGRGLGAFEKGAGAVDTDDVCQELREAMASEQVNAILLDIDSPGGMVSGTPETADLILACEKPIYAFTAGMMASAAYWIGCATDGIFATRTADVGSIGVYCYLLDSSEAYRMAGMKAEVISSGPYKGMGAPGTSLTPQQREHLQERINETAEMFYEHVQRMRTDVQRDSMQGQAFKSSTAMARGLIDQIVSSKEDVLSLLR